MLCHTRGSGRRPAPPVWGAPGKHCVGELRQEVGRHNVAAVVRGLYQLTAAWQRPAERGNAVMKCPKCSYVSHDYLDACRKCGRDLITFKQEIGLQVTRPGDLDLSLVLS